jgi:hypothetical protein
MMVMQIERESVPQCLVSPDRHLKKTLLHLPRKIRPKVECGVSETLVKTDCAFAHVEGPSISCKNLASAYGGNAGRLPRFQRVSACSANLVQAHLRLRPPKARKQAGPRLERPLWKHRGARLPHKPEAWPMPPSVPDLIPAWDRWAGDHQPKDEQHRCKRRKSKGEPPAEET